MAARAGDDIGSSGRIIFYEGTATVEGEQRIHPGRGRVRRRPDTGKLVPIAKACRDEGTNTETTRPKRSTVGALPNHLRLRPDQAVESVPDAIPKHKTVRRPTSS